MGRDANLGTNYNRSFGDHELAPYVGICDDMTDKCPCDFGYTFQRLENKPLRGLTSDSERSHFEKPFTVFDANGCGMFKPDVKGTCDQDVWIDNCVKTLIDQIQMQRIVKRVALLRPIFTMHCGRTI
jgi:hypothetical protein